MQQIRRNYPRGKRRGQNIETGRRDKRKKQTQKSKVGFRRWKKRTQTLWWHWQWTKTNNKSIKTHPYILFFYCSSKRHDHRKSDSHLILRSREIWLLHIRVEKGQDGFIKQGCMSTDIGSQSKLEEFAEPSSAVILVFVKGLTTTMTGMLISTLFLALMKSEPTYRNSSTY